MGDISNMGRCVVCGKPIDMENGDELALMEIGSSEFPEEQVRSAMAEALRRYESPEAHTLANAYEDGEELTMHERCHDNTPLPDMYASDEELEAIE